MYLDRLLNDSSHLILNVAAGAGGHGEGGISTHLYSIGTLLEDLGFGIGEWVDTLYFMGIAAFLITLAVIGFGRRKKIPTTRFQCFLEIIVDGFTKMTVDVLGPKGKIFTSYIGSLFIFILLMNVSGMIPLGHSSTTTLNVTVAMALCTFFLVQYYGIKENGLWGYIKHLLGEPLVFAPLNLPLHIIGELAKPLSLSLRLFGNISGEDTLIAVMISLSAVIFSVIWIPVPLQFPFYFLGILGSLIQALVFATLSAVYISLMMPHDHGEEH